MVFPANIVLLGASAVAGIALIVAGRLLVTTAREMGNPDLDQTARAFIGYWALAVTVAMLSVGTAVTLIVHLSNPSPPRERVARESKSDDAIPPDEPTMTALNESSTKAALIQKR